MVTANGHYFRLGAGALLTKNAAIPFVMQDEVYLVGWWMEINIAFPSVASGFVTAEMSLSGIYKSNLVGVSADDGLTNFGGVLETLNVEHQFHTASGALRFDNHCSTVLPEGCWVPLEKQDTVYVNAQHNVAVTAAVNVFAGIWMYEI